MMVKEKREEDSEPPKHVAISIIYRRMRTACNPSSQSLNSIKAIVLVHL